MIVAEAVWTLSSVLGVMLALVGIWEAVGDRRALRSVPRNGRHLVAGQQLVRYVLRVGIGAAWLGAVLVNDRELLVWLLILANVALLASTVSDLYVGAVLRRIYRPAGGPDNEQRA